MGEGVLGVLPPKKNSVLNGVKYSDDSLIRAPIIRKSR